MRPDDDVMFRLAVLLLLRQGGEVKITREFLADFDFGRYQISLSEDFMASITTAKLVDLYSRPEVEETSSPVQARSERLDQPRRIGPGLG